MAEQSGAEELAITPLDAVHRASGARMVPFSGYAMPVQYADGILAEHDWTRRSAGLFDVSHMGQGRLVAREFATAARALETLVPADILGLRPGQQRYTQLLNEEGGIVDDLMVARPPEGEGLVLVVNAGTKEADWRLIGAHLPEGVALLPERERALLALQGPAAEAVLERLSPGIAQLTFMSFVDRVVAGFACRVSRSGYTGEDGYEISVAGNEVGGLWAALVADERVRPIGLGARDSLRLEAGLPLYGHDINQETSPVEAGLAWSIGKRRRAEGGFPGQIRIARELAEGPIRRRVGLRLDGRAPAREHCDIQDKAGELVGRVTSGGFGPSVGGPVAMGYVVSDFAKVGSELDVVVRGKPLPARVVPLPFWPHKYKR